MNRALVSFDGSGNPDCSRIAQSGGLQAPRDVLPFAGSWRGLEGVAEFDKQLRATMRYDKVELCEYLVSGKHVVAIFLGEGVARATGKP